MVKRDNHYVPHSYLKRWSNSAGKVRTYSILVPHANEHMWKERAPKGIGYHQHLYTRMVAGGESDDIENWFEKDFETPAAGAFQRVLADQALRPEDWRALIRFLAAQDVRTPARLSERLQHWKRIMPKLIDDSLKESVRRREAIVRTGRKIPNAPPVEHSDLFPARTFIETVPGADYGKLHVEATVGRSLWLWSLKHALTTTLESLYKHHWTIFRCPNGWSWLTSDNPVVRLHYSDDKRYHFDGGWNSHGVEIFMPLSPTHLMYTQVGKKSALHEVATVELAFQLQRFTIEHAHRYIFGQTEDRQVALWRPRTVDKAMCDAEKAQWQKWNAEQSEAERAYFNK